MSQPPFDLDARVRTLQIVCAALMLGVIAFGGIALAIGLVQPPRAADQADGLIATLLALISTPQLLAIPIIMASLRPKNGDKKDPNALADAFQKIVIVRAALLEGCAFMNLIAYIIARQWWSPVIAAGCLFFMAAVFPSRNKLREFIETYTSF